MFAPPTEARNPGYHFHHFSLWAGDLSDALNSFELLSETYPKVSFWRFGENKGAVALFDVTDQPVIPNLVLLAEKHNGTIFRAFSDFPLSDAATQAVSLEAFYAVADERERVLMNNCRFPQKIDGGRFPKIKHP